jgi:hypothetical protein
MKSQGSSSTSLTAMGLVAVMGLALGGGCKGDQPKATPEPPAATTAGATARPPRMNRPNPMGAGRDPQVMKDFRIDTCYYGTLSLRAARDAYLASLGKDEPSPKKLPSFGAAAPPPHPGAPGATAAPAARPPGAGSAAPGPVPGERRPDLMRGMPYERHSRACSALVVLKEPPMGDLDAAATAYAPFVVDLAKDITAAQQYYQREEYTKDSFAKGKELDKKLRAEFAKLDETQEKFGAAIEAWRKAHPPDVSKMDDGEKLGRAVLDDARDTYMMMIMKKVDGDAWKGQLDKLDKAITTLRTYGQAHDADPWSKFVIPPVDVFAKSLKEAKPTADKTFDGEAFLGLVNSYVATFDGRQRALARAAMIKASASASPSAEPPPAAPSPP